MPTRTFLEAILHEGREPAHSSEHGYTGKTSFDDIMGWIKYFDDCPDALCFIIPVAYIFDYQCSSITYITPSIQHLIGHEHDTFAGTTGLLKFIDLINPNDFKIYNERIFPKEMDYLAKLPAEEVKDMVFTNTFRMKQSDGQYKVLMARKCYTLKESTKLPRYEFGTLYDVSSVKKELSINHTIERFRKGHNIVSFMKVISEDYFPEMDAGLLTAREKEILTNLSLGTKRKDVGSKLFISDNTVANHIKTILRKTNSKNIREAIALCKKNGII